MVYSGGGLAGQINLTVLSSVSKGPRWTIRPKTATGRLNPGHEVPGPGAYETGKGSEEADR
jgi:hypothetical protein